uniref:G_PROTEIN_RECEP_F1_2 domain-containing protein n=1 Tax=Caenorhabditis tropicalis TaxID=1561998 RepID=A0A1I7UL15_9PELO
MNSSDACYIMESIATYTPLRILLSIFIIIALIAIPLIMNVIRRILRNPLYHLNTKVVLVAHAIALVVHLSDRLVYHGSDLYRYLIILPSSPSACSIISSSERCFGLRLAFNCAMWFCVCTTPALTLERYFATRKICNYHSDKSSWVIVMGFQFFLTAFILSFAYAKQTFGGTAYYCMATNATFPFHILAAFIFVLTVQLISIAFFKHLVRKNENLREELQKSGGDLIRKYQVEETLRAFRILSLPVHLMFIFQFFYCFISFFVVFFNPHFSRPLYFFLMEANIYLPEYSLVFVFTFIRMENQIDTAVYFENYKKDWS